MSNQYSLEGIILKRINFSEADKIVTIFAKKYGRLKVIAKGVRKIKSRRSPHIELFNQARLHLHKGKTFDIVTEAESINTFEYIKKDLPKVNTAYFLVEVIDRLCPELVAHDDIYDKLTNTLKLMESDSDPNLLNIRNYFGNYILHSLGYLPPHQNLADKKLLDFIESLLEGKLKTPDILTKGIENNILK